MSLVGDIGKLPHAVGDIEHAVAGMVHDVAHFLMDRTYTEVDIQQTGGKRIVVGPGLTGGDYYLQPFREAMRRRGHATHVTGILTNLIPMENGIQHLSRVMNKIADEHGAPLVAAGHSMAGMQLFEIARRYPGLIEELHLIGSPTRYPYVTPNPFTRAHLPKWVFDTPRDEWPIIGKDMQTLHRLLEPSPVPLYVYASPKDRIVPPEAVVRDAKHLHEFNMWFNRTHISLMLASEVIDTMNSIIRKEFQPARHGAGEIPSLEAVKAAGSRVKVHA